MDMHRTPDLTILHDPDAVVPMSLVDTNEFRLIASLGHGAMGDVYLAEQTTLGQRLVVLKVTPLTGIEHLRLARLQHTHIVPLFGVRDLPDEHVRQLIMPCMGGVALNTLIERLHDRPGSTLRGTDLLIEMQKVAHPRMVWTGRGGFWKYLQSASYVDSIVWIGACLADGLQYAHDQGLVHLDIKPSNVLITADGVPMLLDFHVAREPIEAGRVVTRGLGGTPLYMAPEHSAAWDALTNQRPLAQGVDGRADIYSLGLLLCEALTGEVPPNVQKLRTLKRDLRDILAKCLEREPSKRYASAGELAHALRRHLNHQSRMRRPSLISGMLLSTAIVFASVAFGWKVWSEQANKDRIESKRNETKFADAMARFHGEVEALRFVVDDPHIFESTRLEWWKYWDNRERILARSLDLSPELREQVRADLLEVAFFLIERDQDIVSQVEECFGVEIVRRIRDLEPESASPRELVLIAQRLLKANQLQRAELVLRDVLRTQPDDFWSWFRLGQVQFRQEAFDDAIASFSVCIGRKPECAECWFNRGVSLLRTSRFDAARRDFEQVLRIAPDHTEATTLSKQCERR